MDTLNLKNYQVETFIKAINYTMPFAKGRVKNRFVEVLLTKVRAMEKNRMEILTSLADKDKEDKPIIVENNYKLSDANMKKWNDEYNKMMQEECIVDITPSIKNDLGTIKDIINSSKVDLDAQQTNIMEEVMTALESTKPKAVKKAK